METPVLKELLCDVTPHWISRLEKYLPPKPTEGLIITPETIGASPAEIKKDAAVLLLPPPEEGRVSPISSTPRRTNGSCTPHANPDKAKAAAAQASKLLASHGISRLDAKPDNNKSRFSSITGPVVYYDGESQQMLCDLWTAMNSKRGSLRKEMMALKRRQQMQQQAMLFAEAADSEDEDKKSDDEDDDAERSTEMLRLRLKMEREKMRRMNRRAGPPMIMDMPYKRARMAESRAPPAPPATDSKIDDEALKTLLEAIDDNFDKACKVTETAAFIWLKGDVCESHLRFIIERLRDTAKRIEKSGLVEKPAEKEKEKEVEKGKGKEVDGSMSPPPVPPARPELARKKSDATMRDVEPLLLDTPNVGQALMIESGSSSEESQAPSIDGGRPEAQLRKHDLTRLANRSPAIVS